MEALERARRDVPRVVRKFMVVTGVTQEQLGAALGLSQRQMSRRLCVPGALAQEELAAIARLFGVSLDTFHKPLQEAVRDLLDVWDPASTTLDEATRVLLESAGQRLVGAAA
jgi:transcriptional regulator with XRE-family HTH domain